MLRMILTDISVRALKAPDSGQSTVWDASSPLGVRISQGGSKTYIVMTGSGKRVTIGKVGIVTLAQARTEARKRLAEKTLGISKPAPTVTFDEAKTIYLDHCKQKNRPGTVASYKRLLAHLAFGKTQLKDIEPRELVRKLDKLEDRPVEHHHAVVAGRIFFTWCVRKHYLDRSPMERMTAPQTKASRDRVLTDNEIAAVYKTALNGETHFHRIVALLALTGQRKSEIAKLQWDWINGQERTITIPGTVTKNKRVHVFPLGDVAQSVISAVPRLSDTYLFPAAREQVRGKPTTVFNGWGKPKAAFDNELKKEGHTVAAWTLHDLRRTLSSGMAKLGVQQGVVEKLLNHVTGGVQSPIAQVYNRYSFMDEMRSALTVWEGRLAALQRPA